MDLLQETNAIESTYLEAGPFLSDRGEERRGEEMPISILLDRLDLNFSLTRSLRILS